MDEIDIAQARQAEDVRLALAAHRARRTSGPGSDTCLECGDPIPAARREAAPGCRLCVDCQAMVEETGRG